MREFINRRVLCALAIGVLTGALGILGAQQVAQKTQRIPQFENQDVKVWRSVVLPNAPLTMHRHEHPRVIIPLVGGTMKIVRAQGRRKSTYGKPAKPIGSPPIRPTRCMRM